MVPRFTGKTRITGKTTEIPERLKIDWCIIELQTFLLPHEYNK